MFFRRSVALISVFWLAACSSVSEPRTKQSVTPKKKVTVEAVSPEAVREGTSNSAAAAKHEPIVAAARAPVETEPAPQWTDAYTIVGNHHKRSRICGPVKGEWLAVRKKDQCLLVVNVEGDGRGEPVRYTEVRWQQSLYFTDKMYVKEQLKRTFPNYTPKQISAILNRQKRCKAGYLVVKTEEGDSNCKALK